MRIGVSARGLAIRVGGVRRMIDEVLRRLPVIGTGHTFLSYQPRGTPVTPGIEPVWVDAPHAAWWEQVSLPRALRRTRPDVLFAPKTMLPMFLPGGVRSVVMVHDLLYFPVRGRYLHEYRWHDIAYNRLFYRASCRRADAVVCNSEHTRRDLLDVCPMPSEKTSVAYLGVTRPRPEQVDERAVGACRARYGVTAPYVLYPGSLSPRKNMVRGVRAWAEIAVTMPHDLVVTAGKSWRDGEVEAEVDRLGMRARFRRLGMVSDDDMPALYAGADALFFPSLYEGFGLPVLEAMACGCPVVTANATSLPEAAGDAARLVDPENEADMVSGLRHVLTDPAYAETLRAKGRERAARFTWERTARTMLDVMERVGAA